MKILIVEDNPKHMQDAIAACEAAGIPRISAVSELDAHELILNRERYGITAVMTDIFIPHTQEQKYVGTDAPCGLAVALRAEKIGLPFVICTAGYHHGARYNWICQLGRSRGWPDMIDHYDPSDMNAEASTKNWAGAIATLQEIVNRRAQSS